MSCVSICKYDDEPKISFASQEAEHQELLRSERVLGALRQAQHSLQQREEELLENCKRLREEVSSLILSHRCAAQVANDPRVSACVALEHDIEERFI